MTWYTHRCSNRHSWEENSPWTCHVSLPLSRGTNHLWSGLGFQAYLCSKLPWIQRQVACTQGMYTHHTHATHTPHTHIPQREEKGPEHRHRMPWRQVSGLESSSIHFLAVPTAYSMMLTSILLDCFLEEALSDLSYPSLSITSPVTS